MLFAFLISQRYTRLGRFQREAEWHMQAALKLGHVGPAKKSAAVLMEINAILADDVSWKIAIEGKLES